VNNVAPSRSSFTGQLKDPALWGVIGGNFFSIILAIWQDWNMAEIMWIYWFQSAIIGVINFIRIRTLKEFCTEGFRMNDKPVPETYKARNQTAYFFLLHYGIFHFAYFIFLWQEMALTAVDITTLLFLLLCVSGFLGAHSYSFAHNLGRDFKQKKPNIGTLMFYPYLRIIPMHLTILAGGALSGEEHNLTLLIFMGLKLCADAGMHMVEHHLFQKTDKAALQL
jgi:hypothetical protein